MLTNEKHNVCPICGSKKYTFVENLVISEWKFGISLDENIKSIPLVKCDFCNHHRADINYYDEELFKFLYPDNSASNAIRSKPNLYKEIIEFNFEFLKLSKKLNIVDFGGGSGDFGVQLNSDTRINNSIDSFLIYDFKTRKINESTTKIDMLNIDFNNLDNYINTISKNKFNYAFCIHVLEHLVNPRNFLETIYHLSENFYFYIEVPATELLDKSNSIIVVHPTHIHYFTLANLTNLISDIGYTIHKSEICNTDDVPRLKMLVSNHKEYKKSIKQFLDEEESNLENVYEYILDNSNIHKIALWGIGHEFRHFVRNYPKIMELVEAGKLILIDSQLNGEKIDSITILPPEELIQTLDLGKLIIFVKDKTTKDSILSDALNLGVSEDKIYYHF